MTDDYYSKSLSGDRLRRCYDIAPPRIQQYLAAEVDFVRSLLRPTDRVLELGCGYGRILHQLVNAASHLVGIDTSNQSIALAQELLHDSPSCELHVMNAVELTFADQSFDFVLCLQNGISAFHVDQKELLSEALRVTRPDGTAVFSSYSPKFWSHRLHWFERQSREGLVGEIDYKATGDGVIVCRDGFTATTVSSKDFLRLAKESGAGAHIHEVDDSSLFCVMSKR